MSIQKQMSSFKISFLVDPMRSHRVGWATWVRHWRRPPTTCQAKWPRCSTKGETTLLLAYHSRVSKMCAASRSKYLEHCNCGSGALMLYDVHLMAPSHHLNQCWCVANWLFLPCGAIWHPSILTLVMVCCLRAQSLSFNQCWWLLRPLLNFNEI